jgi:hypothetical protein
VCTEERASERKRDIEKGIERASEYGERERREGGRSMESERGGREGERDYHTTVKKRL